MVVHVVVGVLQGCAESVQVFKEKGLADLAESKLKEELGIEMGSEAESENHTEVFYNVTIQ